MSEKEAVHDVHSWSRTTFGYIRESKKLCTREYPIFQAQSFCWARTRVEGLVKLDTTKSRAKAIRADAPMSFAVVFLESCCILCEQALLWSFNRSNALVKFIASKCRSRRHDHPADLADVMNELAILKEFFPHSSFPNIRRQGSRNGA